ncbi:MAG TPA: glutamine-hydrolyzing carbamoyl-phosphate synthase small subunit [Syntrophorhabdaceae bacterium]|nr:glutamine-hydrolyzing carbamoyl-phosphate synthase small subunit [Syntrophorhabdaceae bacterium]
MTKTNKAMLALSDGTVFEGYSFGAEGETKGEVVFNTSITGYEEILYDPSYKGQIVTMTYTQMGNYGINKEDVESRRPWVEGFIVKEPFSYPSNWRSEESLEHHLKTHNIVGIWGIDTRALTKHLREIGSMNGVISTVDLDPFRLVKKAKAHPSMAGLNLVDSVTCDKPYKWEQGLWDLEKGYMYPKDHEKRFHVVVYDFGVKYNILRNLVSAGCKITVVPAHTSYTDVLELNPHGIVLSNGPGDPEPVKYAIENIKHLIEKKPIFGICLGHQLLGLALGGRTYKLKFGHRGGNQPVMDLRTKKVEITSQNHGFAVDMESLQHTAHITHINLNDGTVEGLSHKELPLFSVQYHPEASPGPHDASYLYPLFIDMMKRHMDS